MVEKRKRITIATDSTDYPEIVFLINQKDYELNKS
jgi:hypothetical protein